MVKWWGFYCLVAFCRCIHCDDETNAVLSFWCTRFQLLQQLMPIHQFDRQNLSCCQWRASVVSLQWMALCCQHGLWLYSSQWCNGCRPVDSKETDSVVLTTNAVLLSCIQHLFCHWQRVSIVLSRRKPFLNQRGGMWPHPSWWCNGCLLLSIDPIIWRRNNIICRQMFLAAAFFGIGIFLVALFWWGFWWRLFVGWLCFVSGSLQRQLFVVGRFIWLQVSFSSVFCGVIFGAVSSSSHDGFAAESGGSLF